MNKKAMAALGLLGTSCIAPNVYAQNIVYGEDIPSGRENEYVFLEDETILDAYKNLTEEEATSLKVSLESSGYTTVTLKKYNVTTETIESSLEMHFENSEKAKAYIEELEAKGIVVENVDFIYDTKKEEGSLEETYDTLEEAKKALEDFKNEYNEETEESITENKTDKVLETILGTKSYETYEEAKNDLDAFLNDKSNETTKFYFTGEVIGPKGTGEYTTSEIEESFASREEALSYLEELEGKGYIILDHTFTNDTKKEEGSLEETYDTLEEAEKELNDFKNEYNEETEESITENKTDKVLETILGTKSYETYEEAKNDLDAFLNDKSNETTEFYFTGEVIGPKGTGEYTTSEIEESFASREEALSYLEELEEKGYIILDHTFTNDTKKEEGSLEETYDTLEEAEKELNDFKNEYNEETEESITENKTDKVLETILGTKSYETYEDAKNDLDAFLNDKSNETTEFYFTGEVIGPKGTGEYTTSEIEESFASREEALSYLEELEGKGYIILDHTFTNDTKKEEGSLEETYDTLEEAEKELNDFKNEYNEETEESITENKTDKVLETILGTKSYETYEEAKNDLDAFLNDKSNETTEFYFTGEVIGPKGTGEYTTSEIEESFASREEALSYLEELEGKGYIILDHTFTNDTKKEEGSLEETYDTLEEAEKELNDFKNEYNEEITESIETVYDETGNTEEGTYSTEEYLTKSEAENAIQTETSKSDDTYLITGIVSDRIVTSSIESKIFDTIEEAQAYINSIKNQGYDISGIKNEILHYQDGYWVTELGIKIEQSQMSTEEFNYGHFDVTLQNTFTKIDLEGNKTIVNGTIAIDNVEIAGKKIEMTGPTRDMNTGLYEYTSVERFNLNITNTTYAKIEGVITLTDGTKLPFVLEGYLNEDNNVCGGGNWGGGYNRPGFNSKGFDIEFGEIKIIEQKVYIESNLTQKYYVSGNKSQTLYKGDLTKYKKDYDYYVKASGKKTITLESGKLVGSKKIENQGYYYNLQKKAKTHTVKAKGKKTVTLESGKLVGSKKIENQGYYYNLQKKAKTHTVKASGKKTVTLESGKLVGSKKIENQGYYYNLQKKAKTHTVKAKGKKTITLESGKLVGSKKIENQGYYYNLQKKVKTHTVKASGKKKVTLESGNLKANLKEDVIEEFYSLDLVKQKYQFVGGMGGSYEEENPQTGDDSLWVFTFGGFSMIGLAATTYYLKKEDEDESLI